MSRAARSALGPLRIACCRGRASPTSGGGRLRWRRDRREHSAEQRPELRRAAATNDLLPGRPAAGLPAVSGTTLTGQQLSLASYRGESSCSTSGAPGARPAGPRRPALGTLARAAAARRRPVRRHRHPGRAGRGAGVHADFNIGYPSLNDPNDEIALLFRDTVPPAAIPTTLVIDRSGRIAARIFGASSMRAQGCG